MVRRRQPFVCVFIVQMWIRDRVVLQGVADLVFEEESGLVVVDYKTDAARDGEQLLTRYANQLRLYAYAMEQVFHKPVKECVVYAFSLDQSFSLREEESERASL